MTDTRLRALERSVNATRSLEQLRALDAELRRVDGGPHLPVLHSTTNPLAQAAAFSLHAMSPRCTRGNARSLIGLARSILLRQELWPGSLTSRAARLYAVSPCPEPRGHLPCWRTRELRRHPRPWAERVLDHLPPERIDP